MQMSPMLDLMKPVLSQFRKSPIRKAKNSFTSPRKADIQIPPSPHLRTPSKTIKLSFNHRFVKKKISSLVVTPTKSKESNKKDSKDSKSKVSFPPVVTEDIKTPRKP